MAWNTAILEIISMFLNIYIFVIVVGHDKAICPPSSPPLPFPSPPISVIVGLMPDKAILVEIGFVIAVQRSSLPDEVDWFNFVRIHFTEHSPFLMKGSIYTIRIIQKIFTN